MNLQVIKLDDERTSSTRDSVNLPMFTEAGAVAIHFATFLALILLSHEVNSLMSNEVVIRSKDTPTLIAH